MKTLFAIVAVGTLLGLGVLWLHAMPHPVPTPTPAAAPSPNPEVPLLAPLPPAPSPPQGGPTITWSLPQLTATLFPGTISTTTLSFQSDQDLAGVIIEPTPSLSDIVSISPSSLSSIAANQAYQLTLTLTAPPAFQKRSFGGTIHVRNVGSPPRTYAAPLAVNLQINYLTYLTPSLGISFNYPSTWSTPPSPNQPYLTAPPDVDVLDISTQPSLGQSLPQLAQAEIVANNCPAVDSNNQPVDHIISSSAIGVLFVLSCSATTDDYNYIFIAHGQVIHLDYHDNFVSDETESQKIVIFQQIISSLATQ